MTQTEHLQWSEFKDFSGGYWSGRTGPVGIPSTGAQLMTDCMPGTAGGLIAAPIAVLRALPALPVSSPIRRLHVTRGSALADYRYLYAATVSGAIYVIRPEGDSSWTLIHSSPGSWDTHFATYMVDDITYTVFACNGGSAPGLWFYNGSTVTQDLSNGAQAPAFYGPLAEHQGRLFGTTSWGHPETRLIWTDPNGSTWNTNNWLSMGPSVDAQIRSLIVRAPDDMIIATRNRWYLLQGDVANPLLRTMNWEAHTAQGVGPAVWDEGIAYMAAAGIYMTDMGSRHELISKQVALPTTPANGNLEYVNGLLFVPGGLCYDTVSGAWFRSSALGLQGNAKAHSAYVDVDTLFAAGPGSSGNIVTEFYITRPGWWAQSFSWQSPPLFAPGGRQVEIREVQVEFSSGHVGSLTVGVGSGPGSGPGTTSSPVMPGESRVHRFTFRVHGPYLTVNLDYSVDSAQQNTPPTVSAVRVGWRPLHRLP